MFRKSPGSAAAWSPAHVKLCASRQRRILRDVWEALKPGGLLVYSTCTFNTEENEDNLAYLVESLGAEALPLPLQAEWRVGGALKHSYPACRFFPHKTGGEGFFLALVRKRLGEQSETSGAKRAGEPLRPDARPAKRQKPPAGLNRLLLHPERFLIERQRERIQAYPLRHAGLYPRLAKHMRLLSVGLCMGELKGADLLPAHSLAMSRELNRDSFAAIALSREEAVQYLRKEALPLGGEKGYVLLTYRGTPLGFIRRLGSRANNLYPQAWRIRSVSDGTID
jgi:NOL1/NOP2/fmu family ribosome biogenesis protein